MKNVTYFALVLVVGALLGSFLGKFIGFYLPEGNLQKLFATEISAGLHPTQLDLRVLELTIGCVLKFNVTSVLGILLSAFLFKSISK